MSRPDTKPQNFWSRRRAAVQAEEDADLQAVVDAAHAEEQAELEEKTDAEILEELNLPDPDTMQAGDNVQAFMQKAVPDRIRRRALRQLWKLNPALANLDGLIDYGEDFTDAATVIENLQTTYQVGKGMLAHIEKLAEDAAAKEEEAARLAMGNVDAIGDDDSAELALSEQAATEEPDQMTREEVVENQTGETGLTTLVEPDSLPNVMLETENEAPRPRRMRFRFETEST